VSDTEKLKIQNSSLFDEDKITVVENGVSVERQELRLDKKLILDTYDFNIVSLSRISHQKDLETMLLAFHELLKSFKDQKVGLHIIGGYISSDEAYVRRVKALCHQLELETKVVFWNDVAFAGSYLHHFDLYWSTALWEGLPTGVIEAMMQKVLVVGTDVVGNVDLIKMDTGVLTPIKAPEKIAVILREIILTNNSSLIDSAFSFAHNNFSVEQYKRKILALYDEVSL
jgi:glycosyltransferase involved in cell wall biosynthesis